MPRSYPAPAIPREFACWVLRTSTRVTVVNRRTGERTTRPADRWDVRGKSDSIQFSKRFDRAGLAQVWKEQLDRGFGMTWPSIRGAAGSSHPKPRPLPTCAPGHRVRHHRGVLLGEPGLGAEDQDPGCRDIQSGSEVAPGLRGHPGWGRPRGRHGLPGPRQLLVDA